MFFVCLADSGTEDLLDSCEYAIGGYCEDASAYFASGVDDTEFQLSSVTETFPCVTAEGMTDICDMCGQLLPPLSDEELRRKHVQVQFTSYTVTTMTLASAN